MVVEVAQAPLDPDAVVLALKFELLKSHLVERADLRHCLLCLFDLNMCRFKKVNLLEPRYEQVFGDSANACAHVNG